MEWVKFCGILLGKTTEVTACFQAQVDKLQQFADLPATGKTVAFFAITNSGSVTVRKPGDYVAKAIELAGGTYAFRDLKADENAQATHHAPNGGLLHRRQRRRYFDLQQHHRG